MKLTILSILSFIFTPNISASVPEFVCITDVSKCPDGSYVARNINNNCQFAQCPPVPLPIDKICQPGQCLNPVTRQCATSVACFANPCDVSRCDAAASCQVNYCGGCHAIFKDDYGNIIDAANCAVTTVGCGINHCNGYNDGCNVCSCTANGFPLCSKSPCLVGQVTKPFCTLCEPGYILHPTSHECEACFCPMHYDPVCCSGKTYSNQCQATCQQATSCSPAAGACVASVGTDVQCGGFSNCLTYNDGCNYCSCDGSRVECTLMACVTFREARCTLCKTGYRLVGKECILKL